MATRAVSRVDVKSAVQACVMTWTGLLNGDDGTAIEMVDYNDRTVTFTGTFGTGGTIKLQGSNDGTNWFDLTDPQGNAISKTAAGMELVLETPLYLKPIVTAGDGTTSLVCKILMKRG